MWSPLLKLATAHGASPSKLAAIHGAPAAHGAPPLEAILSMHLSNQSAWY